MKKIIWQYWETRGEKPPFVDDLYAIAKKNSGAEVIMVTPASLREYLPDIPDSVLEIGELAHKADMIRSRLIYKYGGMWLDSDAIVLKDLTPFFNCLENHEFVGFTRSGRVGRAHQDIRINCFLGTPQSGILGEWIHQQSTKLPRTRFRWTEVGSQLLGPICADRKEKAKIFKFKLVSPILWNRVEAFAREAIDQSADLKRIDDAFIVMMTNHAMCAKKLPFVTMSAKEISQGTSVLSWVIRKAESANSSLR